MTPYTTLVAFDIRGSSACANAVNLCSCVHGNDLCGHTTAAILAAHAVLGPDRRPFRVGVGMHSMLDDETIATATPLELENFYVLARKEKDGHVPLTVYPVNENIDVWDFDGDLAHARNLIKEPWACTIPLCTSTFTNAGNLVRHVLDSSSHKDIGEHKARLKSAGVSVDVRNEALAVTGDRRKEVLRRYFTDVRNDKLAGDDKV